MDPEVTAVAQKPRCVPFGLREKVTAKVGDLIAKDIVERVDGPTSWVSPCCTKVRGRHQIMC